MAASHSLATRVSVPLDVLSALSEARGLQAAALAERRRHAGVRLCSQAATARVRTCWRALAVVLLARAALVKQAAHLTVFPTAAVAAVQAAVLVRRQQARRRITGRTVALAPLALLAALVALLVRLMAALVPMVRAVAAHTALRLGALRGRVRAVRVALALIWPVVPLVLAVVVVLAVLAAVLHRPVKAALAAHTAVVVVPLATTTNWTRTLGRGRRAVTVPRV